MLTSQLPTTSCEPKSLIWPDLKIGHVEVDFLEYFLFCLPLPCSAFIPSVPSNLWYEEHPMALQIFSCYFGSFGCFWLAAAQRSCAGIPVPACLSSHLLWHKGLFYLPCCTPCSNPGILHISSEAILLSRLPPRICHPALLLTALLSTQQNLVVNLVETVFKECFSFGSCGLLFPCSPVFFCTHRCVCLCLCTLGIGLQWESSLPVSLHIPHSLSNLLFFSICQLDDASTAFEEQWGHPVVTWVKINYSGSCQQDQISKLSCFLCVWLVFHHSSLCCKVLPDRRLGWLTSLVFFFPPHPPSDDVSYLSTTEIRKLCLFLEENGNIF